MLLAGRGWILEWLVDLIVQSDRCSLWFASVIWGWSYQSSLNWPKLYECQIWLLFYNLRRDLVNHSGVSARVRSVLPLRISHCLGHVQSIMISKWFLFTKDLCHLSLYVILGHLLYLILYHVLVVLDGIRFDLRSCLVQRWIVGALHIHLVYRNRSFLLEIGRSIFFRIEVVVNVRGWNTFFWIGIVES